MYLIPLTDHFINRGKKTSGEVFNIGYGKNVSMLDLVKNIKNVTGENFDVIYDKRNEPKNSEVQELLCDLKKIKYTNYSPKISLEDGLKFSFDWFKKIIIYIII